MYPFNESKTWKIVASAGCGKTFILERTILELLQSGVCPNEIMYLIFNRQPADEFRRQLNERGIPDEDMPWINTHHSVCLRLLGLSAKNVLDLKKWYAEKGIEYKEDEMMSQGLTGLHRDLDIKIYENNTKLHPEELALLSKLMEEEQRGKWTHARYLAHALSLQRIPPTVRYVFVDEAQDNVKIQWDYYEFLRTNPSIDGLMIAGDDKQAINNWKGSRGDLFLGFTADRNVCLGKTWRNAPKVLGAANEVVRNIKYRSPLTNESMRSELGIVENRDEINNVLYDVVEEIKQGHRVMILCRNVLWANEIRTILWRQNIPVKTDSFDKIILTLRNFRKVASEPTYENMIRLFSSDAISVKDYWDDFESFRKGKFTSMQKAEFELLRAGEPWCGLWTLLGAKSCLGSVLAEICSNNMKSILWKKTYAQNAKDILQMIKNFGLDFEPVIVSVIHRVKGMECDTAILVRNVTSAVVSSELNDEDDERRVWYTAFTRARTRVILTELFKESRVVTNVI
jgi:superfamily I DNA/RNA helicase